MAHVHCVSSVQVASENATANRVQLDIRLSRVNCSFFRNNPGGPLGGAGVILWVGWSSPGHTSHLTLGVGSILCHTYPRGLP